MADWTKCNLNSSEEDIIKEIKDFRRRGGSNNATEEIIYSSYLTKLLDLKQQEKLLKTQDKFNRKLLENNRNLVRANWAMAGATILLVLADIFLICLQK